jgi:glycosyltransferase involved in cell wall biosynthesis
MARLRICVLGSARSVHVVARARVFRDLGHDVVLVSPAAGDVGDLPLVVIPITPGLAGKIAHLTHLARVIACQRADIYHAHYPAETVAWMAWLLRKRPLVVSVMGGDILFDEQGTLGPIGRWLTRATVRRADLVTVKSEVLADVVRSFGVPDDRIRSVVWGIELGLFGPRDDEGLAVRRDWGVPADVPLLYSPRLLQPLYNQNLMIEALADLPGTWLAVSNYAMDARWGERIRRIASDKGVADRVVWVPGRPRESMAAAYCAADLILSLASSDGFSQTVLEAMACKRAVLVSDLPVYRSTLAHGETAWLTPLDSGSIAEAVRTLLDDAELRRRLGEAGATFAQQNNLGTQARILETELLRLAAHRKRR